MTDNKTGLFIASLRKEKGLTQAQLAKMLNVTDKAVSRWETGKGLPEATLLIPLANALGITVNELLTGERISEEVFFQKSDDNLVSAVQRTEKAVKQGKLAKLMLAVAVILCILSISLLVRNIIKSENTITYTGSFNAENISDVTEMLIDLNAEKSFFTEDTVCTDCSVELNPNGDLIKAEFKLNDEFRHEYTDIILSYGSEQPNKISYSILRQMSVVSSEDGILFTDLCDFLTNTDIIETAKKSCNIKEYDTIFISGDSTLYHNFDGKGHTSFGNRQYIFDGELKKAYNADGMNGKYYEIVVSAFDTPTGNNGQCFSAYIAR